jgi:hypothetical protein
LQTGKNLGLQWTVVAIDNFKGWIASNNLPLLQWTVNQQAHS